MVHDSCPDEPAGAALWGSSLPASQQHHQEPDGGVSPFTPPASLLHQLLADEDESEAQTTDAELPFAAHGSTSTAAQHLEPILRDLGLQQWQLHGGTSAAAALDSLQALLRLHQQLQASRDALQDELHRAKCDVKTADKAIQRLQSQSEQKAQEAGGLNIKLRQLDAWYREETERWGCEREELAKRCGQLEQRHTQFQHELRRRDGEFERLQKQLAALLAGKADRRGSGSGSSRAAGAAAPAAAAPGRLTTHSRAGGFCSTSSSSAAKRSGSGSALDTKRATKAELEELHRGVVEALEADKQDLQQEVRALRQTLQKLQAERREQLNASGAAAARKVAGDSSGDAPPSSDPLAAFRGMQAQLAVLAVRKQRITGGGAAGLQQLPELQAAAQSAGERLLAVKLLEATRIIEEQDQALTQLLRAAGVQDADMPV